MREGFSIGPLVIHYYGVLISLGILVAAWLSIKLAKRQGLDEDYIWDLLPWLVLAGVVGARIWHILTPPQSMVDMGLTTQYYLTHPLDAIAVWNGGLGIPGAVIGGVLAAWIYAQKRKISVLRLLDIVAPGLALAQAIGRWGNFINQELYGMPTTLPWAIFIDPQHRLPEFADQAYYHPLFLYESIANLIICGVLLWITLRVKNRIVGQVFQVYLILYPTVRFLLEFLRLDPSNVRNLNVNQTLMAVIAVASAAVLFWRLRQKSAMPDEAQAPTLSDGEPGLDESAPQTETAGEENTDSAQSPDSPDQESA
jgi:phosphatidylglycerol:prolipoprotein diacylglycerol transferase